MQSAQAINRITLTRLTGDDLSMGKPLTSVNNCFNNCTKKLFCICF
jgi:hypothetical protein